MANERYRVQAAFEAIGNDGVRTRLQDRARRCNDVRTFDCAISPGKSRTLVMDIRPIVETFHPQFLLLVADREGVEWWPIDSATPDVDEDTSPFGWIVDTTAPTFRHVHGQPVASVDNTFTGSNHNNAWVNGFGQILHKEVNGQTIYHDDAFPTWLSVEEDFQDQHLIINTHPEARALGSHLPAGQPKTGYKGIAREGSTLSTAATAQYHQMMYALGIDGYLNLGTPHDGLELHAVIYVEDRNALALGDGNDYLSEAPPGTSTPFRVQLSSYPYTSTYKTKASMPALTPEGFVPWAKDDPALCPYVFRLVSMPQVSGWANPWKIQPGASMWATYSQDIQNGWQAVRLLKGELDIAGTPAFPGTATWSRVTMIKFVFVALNEFTNHYNYVGGLYFGPRPGSLSVLRPYDYTTNRPWSVGSLPAIGLRNPHDKLASVRAIYGSL